MAESQDGIAFSSARVDEVQYGGQHPFNVLQFNESAGVDKAPYFVQRQSDGNKLVTRDPFDPDPSRRYKIVGSERAAVTCVHGLVAFRRCGASHRLSAQRRHHPDEQLGRRGLRRRRLCALRKHELEGTLHDCRLLVPLR